MSKIGKNKEIEFQKLAETARNCRKCEAMCDKTAVLSELNGNLFPKVLFIAEAPGRQGADRTRKPFSGDKSGATFQKLLDSIDLKREEIFITNTVLCSPRSETGANRKPTKKEIKNCAEFLQKTLQLIDPKIIVTLGSVALEALKTIQYHQFTLKNNAANIFEWNGRTLVPLYHPSPQVIASHRREHEQLADFQSLAKAIEISAKQGRVNK
ncbi:MAG TPA: uracil-DNA glycosylase [Pyrinomonadaceae bacterium]|nr:uracil-DNA glycosylase [Pyrinomonadaceae bacterium]